MPFHFRAIAADAIMLLRHDTLPLRALRYATLYVARRFCHADARQPPCHAAATIRILLRHAHIIAAMLLISALCAHAPL